MSKRFNAIPDPDGTHTTLEQAIRAMKEILENLTGNRGGDDTTAVTEDRLVSLGLVDASGEITSLVDEVNTLETDLATVETNLATLTTQTSLQPHFLVGLTSPANAFAIPNTANGYAYQLNGGTNQTITLPTSGSVYDGWHVTIRASGIPSAYQAMQIGGNGSNIRYRGIDASNFVFVGLGEVFRFTWVAGLSVWMAECLVQPGIMQVYRGYTGAGAWNGMLTTPFDMVFTTISATVPHNAATSWVQVPATGIYHRTFRTQFTASGGGGASGWYYMYGAQPSNSAANSSYGFKASYLYLNEDSRFDTVEMTGLMFAGQYTQAYLQASTTAIYYWPDSNTMFMELISR